VISEVALGDRMWPYCVVHFPDNWAAGVRPKAAAYMIRGIISATDPKLPEAPNPYDWPHITYALHL
jgi:hypothetical protein